jgi:hypothetical protein
LRRIAPVLLLELGDELLAGRVLEVRTPERSGDHAQRGLLLGRQGQPVCGGRRQQRDLPQQPGLLILFEKLDAQAPRIEHVHCIRLGCSQLGKLGGEVHLLQGREGFVHDLALVVPLESGQEVFARLIVRRHEVEALVAPVRRILADHFRLRVVLPGAREEVRRALRAGDRRRSPVRADQEDLLLGDFAVHRHHHIGETDAGDDLHLVLFDQLVDQLLREIGLELAVLFDDLHWHAAELAAIAFDHQHQRVVLVLAGRALRPRHLRHEADLERRLCLRGRAHQTRGGQREKPCSGSHTRPLLERLC